MFEQQLESEQAAAVLSLERAMDHMLRFEAALAEAQGELKLIPASAAQVIARVCRQDDAVPPIQLHAARVAGNPAIPFVQHLRRAVERVDAHAANWVHYGATSQDVLDTTLMLALRELIALHRFDLRRLREQLALLAEAHAHTRMAARTLLQHAGVTTFGFKVMQWLQALDDSASELRALEQSGLYVQLAGPIGVLASAGAQRQALLANVARRLELRPPRGAWHTDRAPLIRIATALAVLAGRVAKIARDVTLLMQTEVGELSEGHAPDKGGSSSLPHKHNPVDALTPIAAASIASQLVAGLLQNMTHEHERAAGAWHAEWLMLPHLCSATHGALLASRRLFGALQVHPEQMTANLSLTNGCIFAAALTDALAPHWGRSVAQQRVSEWCEASTTQSVPLRSVAAESISKAPKVQHVDLDTVFSGDADTDAAARAVHEYLKSRAIDD